MDKLAKAGICLGVLLGSSAAWAVGPVVVGALPMIKLNIPDPIKNPASPPASVNLAVAPSNSVAPFTPAPVTFRNPTDTVDVAQINTKNNTHLQSNMALASNSHPDAVRKIIGQGNTTNSCGGNSSIQNLISLNKSDTDTTVDTHPAQVKLSTGEVSGLDLHGDQLIHFAKELKSDDSATTNNSTATSSSPLTTVAVPTTEDHPHISVTSEVVHTVLDNMVSMEGAVQAEAAAISSGGQIVLGAVKEAIQLSSSPATTSTTTTTPTTSPNISSNTLNNSTTSTASNNPILTTSSNINHAIETVIAPATNPQNNSTPALNPPTNSIAINTNTQNNLNNPLNSNSNTNIINHIETGGVVGPEVKAFNPNHDASVVVGQVVQSSGNVAEVDQSGNGHELFVGDNVHLGGKYVFTAGTGNLVIKSFTGELTHIVE